MRIILDRFIKIVLRERGLARLHRRVHVAIFRVSDFAALRQSLQRVEQILGQLAVVSKLLCRLQQGLGAESVFPCGLRILQRHGVGEQGLRQALQNIGVFGIFRGEVFKEGQCLEPTLLFRERHGFGALSRVIVARRRLRSCASDHGNDHRQRVHHQREQRGPVPTVCPHRCLRFRHLARTSRGSCVRQLLLHFFVWRFTNSSSNSRVRRA